VLLTEEMDSYKLKIINELGFTHFLLEIPEKDEEKTHKMIKYTIDHLLSIEGMLPSIQRKLIMISGTT
jgi:hypothetical protein